MTSYKEVEYVKVNNQWLVLIGIGHYCALIQDHGITSSVSKCMIRGWKTEIAERWVGVTE